MIRETSLILKIEQAGRPEECLIWLNWDDCGHINEFICYGNQIEIKHTFSIEENMATLSDCMHMILNHLEISTIVLQVDLPGVDKFGRLESCELKVTWELDETSCDGVLLRYSLSNSAGTWETFGDPHLDSAIVALSKKSLVSIRCCSNCSNADSPYDLEDNFWTGVFCMRDNDKSMQGKLVTQEILRKATISGVWGFHSCPQFKSW